jgi:hypothetical protein
MNESLLTELQKKDSDLIVVSDTGSNLVVRTHLDIGVVLEEEEAKIPPEKPLSIPIRIVRQTFVINAFVFFFIIFFGVSPYYLLSQEDILITQVLLGSSFVIGVLLFFCTYFCMKIEFLLIWFFCFYTFISCLCVILQSLAPLQLCLIFFMEYITILIYCLYSKKKVNALRSIILTSPTGMIVWGLNIYAFTQERDWIAAGVLFFIGVLINPLYIAYEIYKFNQNRVNNDELGKSLIYFYTDLVFGWCSSSKKRKEKEIEMESFHVVGENKNLEL